MLRSTGRRKNNPLDSSTVVYRGRIHGRMEVSSAPATLHGDLDLKFDSIVYLTTIRKSRTTSKRSTPRGSSTSTNNIVRKA